MRRRGGRNLFRDSWQFPFRYAREAVALPWDRTRIDVRAFAAGLSLNFGPGSRALPAGDGSAFGGAAIRAHTPWNRTVATGAGRISCGVRTGKIHDTHCVGPLL